MSNGTSDSAPDPGGFNELKRKSLAGMGAIFVRQVLVKFIFFVGNIVLARMLVPEVFGIYVIVQFVVQFFSTFGDVGIGAALIQKRGELSREELSTTFWLQQVLVWAVVVVVVLVAPIALRLYPTFPPVGVWLIRAMSLSFLFSSLKTIPAILMEREIDFNRIAWVDIIENLAFQGVAITGAFLDWGTWSFVVAAVARGFLGAVLIYSLSSWRPSFYCRFESVKGLLRFGLPYQGSQILSFIKDAVTPLFVGAYAGAAAVGYLNWARNFAFVPLVLSEAFGRVAFPVFSKLQADREFLGRTVDRSIRVLTFVMLPVTAVLIVLGPEITHFFYTDKWVPALDAFYLFSITPLMMGITLPMFSGILSLGNSKILLMMNLVLIFIEWGLGVFFVLEVGFVGISATQPISYLFFTLVYRYILRKHGINVNILKNVSGNILATTLMAITLWYLKGTFISSIYGIVLFSFMGVFIYCLLSFLLNKKIFDESLDFIRQLRIPTC